MATDGLLIGRGPGNLRLIVRCKACRRQRELSGADIVAMGKGDVPLVNLKWRCTNCGSYLTDSVVSGSDMRPKR